MTRVAAITRDSGACGFTLVELMVVVAILGVLASLAAGLGSADPELERTANSLALRIADAAREARAAGPVLGTVAEAEGLAARTRLRIATDSDGQFFAVDRRIEDDEVSSSYHELSRTYVDRDTLIRGVENGVARTEPGGEVTELPDDYELLCAPSGACGPLTLYLESTAGPPAEFRVVVLPLSSMPIVMRGW